jgi:branched-chain amino acid transport system permease protein
MAISILQDFLIGLTFGMLYFLMGAGLTLTMGVLGIANFAHGAMFMVGAYIAWTVSQLLHGTGSAFWISCLMSGAVVGVLAAIIEFFLLRRIYKAEHIYQLMLTFVVVLLIDGLALEIWGAQSRTFALPGFLSGSLRIFGNPFPTYLIFILFVSIFLGVLLWLFLYRTSLGKACRAAAMDSEISQALGINVPRVITLVFSIGGVLVGLAGGLGVGLKGITLGLSAEVIITCFVIVIIGGLGNLQGTLVSALLLGLVESFGGHYFQQFAMALPFILMAFVLILRPQGLLGGR